MRQPVERLIDSSAADTAGLEIHLLGGFSLRSPEEGELGLPLGSKRLLALLALRGRMTRSELAGALWVGASERNAQASLRSALTRLGTSPRRAVHCTFLDVGLAEDVTVDLSVSASLAGRLLDINQPAWRSELTSAFVEVFSQELLPGWYDDWVVVEAERWRQLRLHALETLAVQLTTAGRLPEAIAAAVCAVNADPLRESARAVLINVHLAEGNQSEALREFERYRLLLKAELGLHPTVRLSGLVEHLFSG